MQWLINKYRRRSEYSRHVLTLATGTLFAQAISVLTAPVFTRLLSPEDFGAYAIFFAITSVLTVVSTARYELAIVMPSDDESASSLVILTCTISIAACLLQVLALYAIRYLYDGYPMEWLLFIPVMVLVTCLYQIFYYWLNRRKKYAVLSAGKIVRSVAVVTASFATYIFVRNENTLIIGGIIGQLIATAVLVVYAFRGSLSQHIRRSVWQIKAVAIKYGDFPKYALPSAMTNTLTGYSPTILLSMFYGTTIVGFYSLTQRVLSVPISLLATAISDVFKQRASMEYSQNGNCRIAFNATMKKLFMISIPIFIIVAIVAPWAFDNLFGAEWSEAGRYAQIMSIMYLMSFAVSPLSYVFFVASKQRQNMLWQLTLLGGCSFAIYIGTLVGGPAYSITMYSIVYFVMYIVCLLMSYAYAQGMHVTQFPWLKLTRNGNEACSVEYRPNTPD